MKQASLQMLGYKKSRNALMAHVDGEDKKDALIQGPLGGLYSLVLASKPKVWG
jgi:anti-repressor protein